MLRPHVFSGVKRLWPLGFQSASPLCIFSGSSKSLTIRLFVMFCPCVFLEGRNLEPLCFLICFALAYF
jgi:hypothetical protein